MFKVLVVHPTQLEQALNYPGDFLGSDFKHGQMKPINIFQEDLPPGETNICRGESSTVQYRIVYND